jgi:hypothetical protein
VVATHESSTYNTFTAAAATHFCRGSRSPGELLRDPPRKRLCAVDAKLVALSADNITGGVFLFPAIPL